MPPEANPGGAPATGATGSEPGATTQPTSQGPNDPINPPASGGSPAPATGEQQGGAGSQETPDQIALRNAREANARMAAERDEARRLLEDERRKGLSDEERKRLASLDEQQKASAARERQLTLRYEIATRAGRLGLVDPEVAVMLLERSDKVTVSETGQVAGLDDALKDLIKEKPFLVKATTTPADGGAGAGGPRPGGKPSMNDIIRGAARGTIREG